MALADVERMQQEGISNSHWKQVLQWGCFNIFFPVAPCPLCCFLGDWGAAVPSFQTGANPGNACERLGNTRVRGNLPSMIHSPADSEFWCCTSDNKNPHTREYFSTKPTLLGHCTPTPAKIRENGDFTLDFSHFPASQWVAFPFLLPFSFSSAERTYLWGR